MKYTVFVLSLAMAITVVASVGSLSWKATSLDLGEIKANESIDLSFSFENTTSEEVFITNAKGSCGCTQVEFSKEGIAPGSTAEITAKFKSSKVGAFNKTIKVTTSASEEQTVLSFRGTAVE
ncbi:MAG: DUF1573 domain-containing protein [Cyclobacteriaceae bacterium]